MKPMPLAYRKRCASNQKRCLKALAEGWRRNRLTWRGKRLAGLVP